MPFRDFMISKTWICRFPNVVGDRSTHGIIFDLLEKLDREILHNLEVLGDGKQSKPYMYVHELNSGLCCIFLKKLMKK